MYMLGQDGDSLSQLRVKLQLVGVAHDRPRFPDPYMGSNMTYWLVRRWMPTNIPSLHLDPSPATPPS